VPGSLENCEIGIKTLPEGTLRVQHEDIVADLEPLRLALGGALERYR
jgi:hypothetical protein